MSEKFSFLDTIPFSIAAGESLPLPAGSWDFIYCAELSGGDLLAEGDSFRLPLIVGREVRAVKREVGTIQITNRGGTTAVGVLHVGSGEVTDRSTVGNISVSNFPAGFDVNNIASEIELARILAASGGEFIAGAKAAPGGSDYGYIQLFNPVGSGKTIFVDRFMVSISANNYPTLRRFTTALSTIYAASIASMDKSGASAPVAELRYENNVSTALGTELVNYYALTGEPVEFIKGSPIKLAPGEGIGCRAQSTVVSLWGLFEWTEE